MRQLNIKRRIRDICIICLIIFILLTTIMNASVLAAGAMDSDPGVDLNGGSTTGTNITSISELFYYYIFIKYLNKTKKLLYNHNCKGMI